jgi:hypothetical protein
MNPKTQERLINAAKVKINKKKQGKPQKKARKKSLEAQAAVLVQWHQLHVLDQLWLTSEMQDPDIVFN